MKHLVKRAFDMTPLLRDWLRTRGTAAPISMPGLLKHRIHPHGRRPYWPVHPTSLVTGCEYILTGIGTAPGLSPGCFICAGPAGITIGDYTIVAPNVGIIGVNHDLADYNAYIAKPVSIGRYCWIGMNAVVLPGVVLGHHTVVGGRRRGDEAVPRWTLRSGREPCTDPASA